MNCGGSSASVSDCGVVFGTHSCVHHTQDVNVRCISHNYPVRLSGGFNSSEGRLEVFVSSRWTPVCHKNFDSNDAYVVCSQLGYKGVEEIVEESVFGSDGIFLLSDVQCNGTEDSLSQCGFKVNTVNGFEDCTSVGIRCTTRSPNGLRPIRLVGGAGAGRLEVYNGSSWGSVCNLDWSVEDSKTVCRDLGYSVEPLPITVDYRSFGRGGGPIKISRISCKGNESHFRDCLFASNVSGCGHDNDVAVVCQGSESCTDFSLRLVGGASDLIGRLEMCYRGHWGTVCGDSTGSSSSSIASVSCRQLGYSPTEGRVLPYDEFYEKRQGVIWLGGVSCRGNESRLIDCSHLPVGRLSDGCSGHFQDMILQCQASTEFKIRVRGNQNSFITSGRGRVEVQYNGLWGTVCDTQWDLNAATVVCREMGWGRAVRPSFASEFGQTWGPIWMDFVRCRGDETSLEKCGHTGWGLVSSCTHRNDAGVVCTNSTGAVSISVQLSGGVVSVQYNGEWGLVCYDGWDYRDATVACKELGYESVYSIGSSPHRPNVSPNPPTVWLSKIHCQGNESSLSQCIYGWGSFNCSSHEGYATLSCSNSDPSSLPIATRLANGTSASNGIISIRYGGVWGRVCSSHWTIRDANIVCRGLGYSRAKGLKILDVSYSNLDPIWMDNVQCIGNENHLQDCYFDGWGHHTHQTTCKSMFVSCKNENFDLKLYNRQNDNSGLLQVYYSGGWGFVCDSDWSLHNSHVACKQLGFGSAESSYTLSTPPVRGLVLMDVVKCTGAESRFVDCPFKGWGYARARCNGSNYVGAVCSNHGNSEMNLRLIGSDSETKGLVQVQYSGRWGYVCGNYWGDFEAKVICNQLGLYPPPVGYSSVSFTAYRPEPSDTVWLDNVQCSGGEERFSECHHDEIGTHSCSVSSPVGAVDCNYKDPNQFSVRLVGGASPNEGRVQVYYNGWKSVCGSGWGFRDARVVCRQLGYGDALNVPTSSLYGIRRPDELSIMDNVQCSGEESLLKNCDHTFGNLECSVTNVASAICTDVSHPVVTTVRLNPSSSPSTGTVQVLYNGSWGSVCSNGWDINDAHVACRQLGYPSAVRTGLSVLFSLEPVSDSPIWLSGVNCEGTESSIGQCLIERGWGDVGSGCTHSFDVAVECTEPKSSNLSIRLISGGVPYKGRIQVLMNGTWAGVCGDKFRATNGNVVCRQLGYSRSLIAFNGSEHYSSFLPDELVLLSGLNCIGTEGSLIDCPTTVSTLISEGECKVGPANVICDVAPQIPTPPNSTRLVDVSLSGYKGKLFVYDGSTWGTVCDDFIFTKPVIGKVVCRSIGYAGPTQIFGESDGLYPNEFSITDPIHLDDVQCNGNERSIFDCPHTTETAGCEHAEDVSIECSSIRLDSVRARLTDIRSGIVEVLYGDQWSYVCVTNNDWSLPEANVVCRELGYTGASSAYTTSEYEIQPGALIDGVNCTGNETRLSHCIINEWNVTKDCSSFAGAECIVTMDSVRLVGGVSSNEGRVEILRNGVSSSVCDEGWGLPDAEVICRVLGYPRASRTLAGSWFGKGEGAVWSGVDCTGNEASLSFCPNNTGSTSSACNSHSNDASVVCSSSSSVSQTFLCADGDVRLTKNGMILEGQSQGRLEICVGGEWGRVCIGGWGYEEAALVCRQLGFRVEGASRISSSQFGFGYRPILIDTLQCTGLESSLLQCGHTLLAPGTYDQSCDSTQDVAVSCQTVVSSPVRIRLVGGNVEWAGRVEIHLPDNAMWGRVCDDGWSLASARVVCRQLGYGYAIGATIGTTFGRGSRSLGYGRVTCVGLESGLSNCYHDNQLSCDISHVAGAVCSDTPTPPNVRLRLLSNGNKPEGILQVYFAEKWGRVCTTSGWSLTTADIACHHLGEGLAVSTMGVSTSSQDSFFWLSGVRCFGNETRLQECQHLGWGYAGEECYEGSTSVWLNCSGNSNTQTSTSIPTLTATPSAGPVEPGASSLPVLAVISPTIAAILLFTCLIIVSILFYINHRKHKGRMYRISSPDEGMEVQERGIPKKRKKNVVISPSKASQLHLLSSEAMSPPMSPSYSKSSSLTRSEQRLDVSMMTITSELINSTAPNDSTSPETTDYNSPPFSPTRIESTMPPSPSPTPANNDSITLTPQPNLNSSTRSNEPLTLDAALHTDSSLSTSFSTYDKPPLTSSSSLSSGRYADLDVLSSQHNAAKRASMVSSSGSNSRAQYATIQEVMPRKISVNTETTTV
ncbi:PREDICTED: scavenger receptor cysteine-rich type 1 protein M160-like [Amphimedon queenslandica]|nr:PREDICTED: scavenger receptor cysteine-rich type 1 protein M160-like [Amphimedon queenslandica]|eukprot:XP_019852771.1 PREDICTED: scavenger receptor cysteine-rich type 1 protein M160-like [Amphimedon queenslandica]